MKKVIGILAIIGLVTMFVGCKQPETPTPSGGTGETGETNPTPTTPVFTPVTGTDMEQGDEITITSATGVRIYYTTDDSTYDGYNWTPYNPNAKPTIDFRSGTSVSYKAIAVRDGMPNSSVASAIFNKMKKIVTPTFAPSNGTFLDDDADVTITSTIEGADIYYTTGTSEYSAGNWLKYNASSKPKINFGSETSVTYKAIAIKVGMTNSDVVTVTYYKDGSFNDYNISNYGITMKAIERGEFDLYGDDSKMVTVSDFYMGETEVTQGQWKAVMGADWPGSSSPSSSYGEGDDYPAYYISWYDAIAFCNKLSIKEDLTPVYSVKVSGTEVDWANITGADTPDSTDTDWDAATANWEANGYRLPTEAEWEYAAGGGAENRTKYAGTSVDGNEDGVDDLGDYAWYSENNGESGTATYGSKEVEKKKANSLGLYDMSGNVCEWCWDWYKSSYDTSVTENPTGLNSGTCRVNRGGSCYDYGSYCRVASRRGNDDAYDRYYSVGFRMARAL